MSGFEEYGDLQGVGFEGQKETVAPEDEFFKSVYIAGITRKNHINIEEEAGKIQIRGLEYNKTEVHMIITHTKSILVREANKGTRDLYSCFSYKDGAAPWYGTSKLEDGRNRTCPATSSERAINNFCSSCRAQILVAGIYCKSNGEPITNEEGKPVFIFLRGKGTKYGNISGYLDDMYKLELSPIFEPVTEQSQAFEKAVVNNKRFVTKITMGKASTQYGEKNVFVLEKGPSMDKDSVMNILQVSKKTLDKFNEKFDWSRKQKRTTTPQEGVLSMDADTPPDVVEPETKEPENKTTTSESNTSFSFDKIEF